MMNATTGKKRGKKEESCTKCASLLYIGGAEAAVKIKSSRQNHKRPVIRTTAIQRKRFSRGFVYMVSSNDDTRNFSRFSRNCGFNRGAHVTFPTSAIFSNDVVLTAGSDDVVVCSTILRTPTTTSGHFIKMPF